ncbi:hypothetical protein SAY86_012335 [Trapa natans]|uniref:DUF7642 domain-containing protein n=1 Tax=Trapa natans TaxID=22666 RepID=A0AAN7RBH8_TRANT|nr:hypothetical protein SAY86_012335 [Trapa natans]
MSVAIGFEFDIHFILSDFGRIYSSIIAMLMGHTDSLPEHSASTSRLLPGYGSEIDDDRGSDPGEPVLYTASFEEFAGNHIKYDTIIWLSISLLLVLAWGVGIIMLLYLPFRRYVLQKDISSRQLHVTPTKIVYKVSRPSFIPFWGVLTIERKIPLSLVIDIIIEQGCLQSIFGIHTFRIESLAHGKAAPVDELLLQGVSNPGMLRKIIITEACKVIQESGKFWKPVAITGEGDTVNPVGSVNEGQTILRSPSKNLKMTTSPMYTSMERRLSGVGMPGEVLLNKLEEVNKSVKKIETLIEKSQGGPGER